MRFLTASWASIVHAYIVLLFFELGVLWVSPCWWSSQFVSVGSFGAFEDVLLEVFHDLHGIADSICTSSFYRDFLNEILELHVIRTDLIDLPQLSSIVEHRLLCRPMRFSVCREFFYTFVQTYGHMYSGLDVA